MAALHEKGKDFEKVMLVMERRLGLTWYSTAQGSMRDRAARSLSFCSHGTYCALKPRGSTPCRLFAPHAGSWRLLVVGRITLYQPLRSFDPSRLCRSYVGDVCSSASASDKLPRGLGNAGILMRKPCLMWTRHPEMFLLWYTTCWGRRDFCR